MHRQMRTTWASPHNSCPLAFILCMISSRSTGRTDDLLLVHRKWQKWRDFAEVISSQIGWFWVHQIRDDPGKSWLNKVKALIAWNYIWPLGSEWRWPPGNSQQKAGAASYSHKEINSANNLNELEGNFSPSLASSWKYSPANTLRTAL